jgi:REP element-mobilizing transposase RayT
MGSYRQILYHIVFRTKNSRKTLSLEHNDKLYAYIMGIIKKKNCHLYRINGMQEHIHILSDLHPSMALADLMREIKTSSSVWLKQQSDFKKFEGWADGYAALTKSYHDKIRVLKYIKNQQDHHKTESFSNELRRLIEEEGIDIDERYFLK